MSRSMGQRSTSQRLLAVGWLIGALASAAGCRTVLGLDSEEPPAGGDGGDATPDGTPDASDGAAQCEPSCTARACGNDPVCGVTCGACSANQACEENEAGAKCSAATLVWEVDGTEIARFASSEIFTYQTGSTIWFPYWGRSVTLNIPTTAGVGPYTSCPEDDWTKSVTLSTADDPHAGLSALPARWKGLTFVKCGQATTGDTVTAADVTLTFVGPTRVAGTWEFVVQGAGPRAGSTLRAYGAFDLTPPPL